MIVAIVIKMAISTINGANDFIFSGIMCKVISTIDTRSFGNVTEWKDL